ncbi:MAG: class A beta-lactamase-related serine hydrolase [Alicyclobacillaceae bacterium]|nr:class A beta-lactamase-related serine hydrolase [Alicyclobacillaceae bacterium]
MYTPYRPGEPFVPARHRTTRKRRRRRLLRLLIAALLLGWAGFEGGKVASNWVRSEGVPQTAPDYQELRQAVASYLAAQPGTYGVVVIDLASGARMDIDGDRVFYAASTFKLPLNLYLYTQIAQGKIDPATKLTYEASDYEEGTGWIASTPFGSQYTIRELSQASIVASDNVATNMLLDYLGIDNVKSFMAQLGGKQVVDGKNVTTAADMALYAAKLYEFANQHPDTAAPLLDDLEHTDFNDRIPAKLPPDVPVAHKIGNWTDQWHDVGIVFLPGRPYVISLFSRDIDQSTAARVLSTVSRMVYDAQVRAAGRS